MNTFALDRKLTVDISVKHNEERMLGESDTHKTYCKIMFRDKIANKI